MSSTPEELYLKSYTRYGDWNEEPASDAFEDADTRAEFEREWRDGR